MLAGTPWRVLGLLGTSHHHLCDWPLLWLWVRPVKDRGGGRERRLLRGWAPHLPSTNGTCHTCCLTSSETGPPVCGMSEKETPWDNFLSGDGGQFAELERSCLVTLPTVLSRACIYRNIYPSWGAVHWILPTSASWVEE